MVPENDSGVSDEGMSETILSMDDDGQLAVEVDVQVGQLTLKASHPQALPDEVAQLSDVKEVFGEVSMQACLTEQTAARACYRVVGRCHDIEFWPARDDKLPQLDHFRVRVKQSKTQPYKPKSLMDPSCTRTRRHTTLMSSTRRRRCGCPLCLSLSRHV